MSLHDGMHGDHIHHHEEHQDHLQHTTPSPDHHTPFSADMNIQYHDHHTTSHAMDMMKMYFHGGYNEVILFDFWRISSIGGLIGSMIGCFLLGILYEGLKFFREFLISYELRKSSYTHVSPTPVDVNDDTTVTSNNGNNSDSIHTTEQAVSSSTPSPARRNNQVKIIQTSLLSRGHLIQTLLQFIQVWLSYCLMLIFMTYNTWLCLSVSLGAGAGYFIFGWKKTVVMDVGADHCH